MKTELSQFCNDYVEVLNPVSQSLQTTVQSIEQDSHNEVLQSTLSQLKDLDHRLQTLVRKVEQQQTFLLIFGPLKSGKSTLMNALSGTYVSEVSAMPAYPCLVFVGHGETQQVAVSWYNGRKMTFPDNTVMHSLIQEAHASLADRIRQVEENGETFDPNVHFPEAIRRIDVQLPATNLKEASTVLVDTPGLYSRMRFGYDLLTREFRNSAACAVFVVKTDNLFLDQVFAEFNDLLDLFSRIFLVVNIDSNKRDLHPDGTLKPSMESQHPEKIISAFRSLSMSAPLRRAAEEGRVKIYPIDLLSAATQLVKFFPAAKANPTNPPGGTEDEPVAPPPEGPEDQPGWPDAEEQEIEPEYDEADIEEEKRDWIDEEYDDEDRMGEDDRSAPLRSDGKVSNEGEPATGSAPVGSAGTGDPHAEAAKRAFDRFVRDLTQYLNSSDYLTEFMRDTLRQGKSLGEDLRQQPDSKGKEALKRERETIEENLRAVNVKLEAVERLKTGDWDAAFDRVYEQNEKKADALAAVVREKMGNSMLKSLDHWFESRASLNDLQERYWNPILRSCASQLSAEIRSQVSKLIDNPFGGAELSLDSIRRLDRIEVSLSELHEKVMNQSLFDSGSDSFDLALDPSAIPVRRGLLDWILFRSRNAVRHRLFGSFHEPYREIRPEMKRRRLGIDGREALKKVMESHLESLFPAMPRRRAIQLLENYINGFCQELKQVLDAVKRVQDEKKKELQLQLTANQRIQTLFEQLSQQAAMVLREHKRLCREYHCGPLDDEDESVGLSEA